MAEENNGTQGAAQGEKTFTQAELNAIVQKRVGELTAKYENYEEMKAKAQKLDKLEEESKTELQKATDKANSLQKKLDEMEKAEQVRKIREEVSKDTGVPADLITGETKEECEKQAKGIADFAKPGTYPTVKDKGEAKTDDKGGATRDQFAEWASEVLGGN